MERNHFKACFTSQKMTRLLEIMALLVKKCTIIGCSVSETVFATVAHVCRSIYINYLENGLTKWWLLYFISTFYIFYMLAVATV